MLLYYNSNIDCNWLSFSSIDYEVLNAVLCMENWYGLSLVGSKKQMYMRVLNAASPLEGSANIVLERSRSTTGLKQLHVLDRTRTRIVAELAAEQKATSDHLTPCSIQMHIRSPTATTQQMLLLYFIGATGGNTMKDGWIYSGRADCLGCLYALPIPNSFLPRPDSIWSPCTRCLVGRPRRTAKPMKTKKSPQNEL